MSSFHWHPSIVLALGGLLALYVAGIGPVGRRVGWAPAGATAGRGRVAAFVSGIAVTGAALLGPVAEWAEHVALSAHMVQHLALTLVVPPLWLLGTPDWLLRPLLRLPGVARAGYVLTRPPLALAVASAALVVWHLPGFYGAALTREPLHILEHLTLLGTALLAWWPIAGALPEWRRPAPPAQLLYLFLATVPMTAAAAPITLADGVLYPFYEEPRTPWPLSPRADQELAGILMWMGSMFGYLAAGTIVFFRWAAQEGGEGVEAADGGGGAAAPSAPPGGVGPLRRSSSRGRGRAGDAARGASRQGRGRTRAVPE